MGETPKLGSKHDVIEEDLDQEPIKHQKPDVDTLQIDSSNIPNTASAAPTMPTTSRSESKPTQQKQGTDFVTDTVRSTLEQLKKSSSASAVSAAAAASASASGYAPAHAPIPLDEVTKNDLADIKGLRSAITEIFEKYYQKGTPEEFEKKLRETLYSQKWSLKSRDLFMQHELKPMRKKFDQMPPKPHAS